MQGIRALGIRGSNVSMPNKQAIIPYLDEVSPEAALIGAVNTVTNIDGKGHLVGYNTDGIGAMEALKDEGVEVKDQIITLTGLEALVQPLQSKRLLMVPKSYESLMLTMLFSRMLKKLLEN